MDPVRDRPSVYTGPFCNRSETDPNGSKTGHAVLQVLFWIRLDPFRAVQERSRVTLGSIPNGSM